MDQRVLNARRRTELGKGANARCRKEGQMPAVMYDRFGKSVPISVAGHEFNKMVREITESTILKILLDGKDESEVLLKDYQYNIINDTIIHADFYELERGRPLRTKIKIKVTGSPEGIRLGGILETGVSEVEVECLPKDLPERIVVDVTDLELNNYLHVSDIKVASGVKILTNPGLAVVGLKFTHADAPADADAESTTEEKTAE